MNKAIYALISLGLLLILSATAQEFTLDIFGNANGDDLIDEEDISYLQGILDGENEKTDLSDANNDGKVDENDIDQIEQIIQGTESEIYYIDAFGNASRVKHPLERIILVYDNTAEIIRILGAEERVVGVDSEGSSGAIGKYPTYFPQFIQTASIGNRNDCDVEAILKLHPDAIIIGTKTGCPYLEEKLMGSDIDVVYLETWSKGTPSLFTLAYMLDEVDRALEYQEWKDGYLDMVAERVATIPEGERVKVFVDRPGNTTVVRGSGYSEAIELAGGINIAADLADSLRVDAGISSKNTLPPVETEWVLEQNPDAIIGLSWNGGYEVDDESVLKERYDEIMGTAGFGETNAGKNGRIYVTYFINTLGAGDHIGVLYFAKWLYPDLFGDLDPEQVHQEYIDRFQNVDYDLKEHGAFVYPPMS